MLLLRAVGAFEYEGGSEKFCESAGLRAKAMNEIRKLRKQLTLEVNVLVEGNSQVSLDPQMKPPTDEAATVLRQILLSGLPDRIARKIKDDEIKDDEDKKKLKYAYRYFCCLFLSNSRVQKYSDNHSYLNTDVENWKSLL